MFNLPASSSSADYLLCHLQRGCMASLANVLGCATAWINCVAGNKSLALVWCDSLLGKQSEILQSLMGYPKP